jgi:general secretion pathway protein C
MWYDNVISKGVEPVRWLLVALIAYTLATTIWSFFDTPAAPAVSEAPAATQPAAPRRPPANVNWILAKHLFGEAGRAPVEQAPSNEPAVQTRLPLELQSVFVADEISESAAIVAQRGKPGKLYGVGDTLPGSAELVDVLTDRIILRRAGSRETLMFPKSQSQFIAEPGAEDADEQPDMLNGDLDDSQDMGASYDEPDVNTLGEEAISTDEDPMQVVESYRQRLADDAAGTLDELGLETVDASAGGGYRIGSAVESPYLQQTGLQPGDVILSVNGRPVGDIQQDQMELANIMAQGSARIEVQRGSRRFFITASLGNLK